MPDIFPDQTPTEMMIDRFEKLDDVVAAMVIFRHNNGMTSYRCSGMDTLQVLGLMSFLKLNIEYDISASWKK